MSDATNLMEFNLVDPRELANGKSVNDATVVRVLVLLQVDLSLSEMDKLSNRDLARFINRNIKDQQHTKGGREKLQGQNRGRGCWVFSYCSLCGSPIDQKECKRCKIKFPSNEVSSKNCPYLPQKVIGLMQSAQHRFISTPPR